MLCIGRYDALPLGKHSLAKHLASEEAQDAAKQAKLWQLSSTSCALRPTLDGLWHDVAPVVRAATITATIAPTEPLSAAMQAAAASYGGGATRW